MHVFVTGASGFIGSAVVKELIGSGHDVLGLARSDTSAEAIAAAGADVHRGSLEDLDSLRAGAAEADGVIHTGYIHDFSNIVASGEIDRAAIETLGDELADSGRPLIVSAGVLGLSGRGVATENDQFEPGFHHRVASEEATLSLAANGVRSVVLRLPPSVHGEGDKAFVPQLIQLAREKGAFGFPGDGSGRWSAVHRLDVARLFVLAVESAPPGCILHGVAEEAVSTREIATVIGDRLALPVSSVPFAEVDAFFGWIGRYFAMEGAASSDLTRRRLGWEPTRPGLIEDLSEDYYF